MKWETTTMRLHFSEATGVLDIRPQENFNDFETVTHAKENIEEGLMRVGDAAKAIVVEMPNHYVNAEVTRYYRNNMPDMPIALVADSYFKRMIGNFILSLDTQGRPTKLFKSFDEAHNWIKEVL
jgi:hypothetical protein